MNLEESKKKETVRISKKDLLKLLSENEQMAKQITELQAEINELTDKNRKMTTAAIKKAIEKKESEALAEEKSNELDKEDIEELLKPKPRPSYPSFRRDVYFDGSNNR